MLTLSRRFRLRDVRLALPPGKPHLELRFHEPHDATGVFAPIAGPARFIRVVVFPSESAPDEPGANSNDAILEASIEVAPSADVLSFFRSVSEGRFPEGVPDSPEREHFFAGMKAGDPLPPDRDLNAAWMTPPADEYVEAAYATLVDYARRVGGLFRWTTSSHEVLGAPYAVPFSVVTWSLDGSASRPILPTVSVSISPMAPPVVPQMGVEKVIVAVGQLGKSAPVADEIIREAWALRDTNPRAAVVLAMAAAEAGFRRLVAVLVPDATYLVEEMQSPPLRRLLREYLPNLPVRSTPRLDLLPKATVRKLTDAVELRNKIVHAGAAGPDGPAVDDALTVASDLVRLFDYYAGNAWALDFVSEEVRDALGSTGASGNSQPSK